eukprot:CAMPEP_0196574314 /NCGR_PEP_ID=MMETSP1081-20130531/4055_1 /TAXON_ID=36882 /ORGANISM="Pyramimonas amylifera, Strain CCMP720" /LENGTH=418 /DNA_ID=CAMNT_0041892303 /DNA_START=129 /DNA_END=1382 /DNA_ORIENTATION=+
MLTNVAKGLPQLRSQSFTTRPRSLNAHRAGLNVRCAAGKKVVVVGGTGRVGSSTAAALKALDPDIQITLAGRSREHFETAKSNWEGLEHAVFSQCELSDADSLMKTIDGADLVVHTAGPFQRKKTCAVLEAAIATKTPYIDVCDDMEYSKMAKALSPSAEAAGIPAITTTGIYPGVSNVMAAEMVAAVKKTQDGEGTVPTPEKLEFSYFTPGSGGLGPTILETSFLLCGEEVTAFKDGKAITVKPGSYRNVVDFGEGVGEREVFLYNLPEVYSAHTIMNIPSVSARFGTSPGVFNSGMNLITSVGPKSLFESAESVKFLVALATPFVKLADVFEGETCAMKVELTFSDGSSPCGLYVHPKLSVCVGQAAAAFALNVLEGGTSPGVWYPEQDEAVSDRSLLLKRASQGTKKFIMNKPAW